MSITFDYSADSLRVSGLGGSALSSPDAAADSLADVAVLRRYWATVWAAPGGVLEDAFCSTVSKFVVACRRDTVAYLSGTQKFDSISRRFIQQLPALGLSLVDPLACLDELRFGAVAVQAEVESVLAKCTQRRGVMNILGYGADACRFEHDLGHRAVKQGRAGSYRIYRYDPFAPPAPNIVDLSAANLRRPSNAGIDLITARWALHHVEPQDRWSQLNACLARLDDGGHFVLVEQGDFTDRDDPRLEHRLYRILVMANDVLANYVLRPSWFAHTALEFGADFHVDYLDSSDLCTIESGFRRPFRRTVHPVRAGNRSGETVIVYHVAH